MTFTLKFIIEEMNNNTKIINVNRNTNTIAVSKPAFLHLKKYFSNGYEDIRVQLNEYILATNNITY